MKKTLLMTLSILILIAGVSPAADFNGDGTGDLAIFRESTGLWAVRGVTRVYFGLTGDDPVPGDYNGSGRDSIAVFRSGTGLWAVRGVTRVYFGSASDQARPSDIDGDRTDDFGVFRSTNGLWAFRSVTRVYFGSSSDEPLAPGRATGPIECPLPVTGQTISYRTGDDGYHQAGAAFDFDKFTLPGGTITIDNNTGLIWASDGNATGCNFGQMTDWSSAVYWCNNLTFAGSSDWRLPNAKELQTIVDYSKSYPPIDETFFPNTVDNLYWTSTTNDYLGSQAWATKFDLGLTFAYGKTTKLYLRAVAGPDL